MNKTSDEIHWVVFILEKVEQRNVSLDVEVLVHNDMQRVGHKCTYTYNKVR